MGCQLGRGERAHACERRLAQRDLTAHAHHDSERKEDDAHHDSLRDEEQPVARQDEERHHEEDTDEGGEHDPVQAIEGGVAEGGGQRGRRRADAGEGVGHVAPSQTGPEQEQAEQHQERHRGPEPLHQLVAEGQVLGQHFLANTEDDAPEQGQGQAAQPAEGGGGDGGDDQHGEVVGIDACIERRQEHTREGGDQAR